MGWDGVGWYRMGESKTRWGRVGLDRVTRIQQISCVTISLSDRSSDEIALREVLCSTDCRRDIKHGDVTPDID